MGVADPSDAGKDRGNGRKKKFEVRGQSIPGEAESLARVIGGGAVSEQKKNQMACPLGGLKDQAER